MNNYVKQCELMTNYFRKLRVVTGENRLILGPNLENAVFGILPRRRGKPRLYRRKALFPQQVG
jgi:hypothetical protein